MGEGQRSRMARDPYSRTLGFIPRGDLYDLRHFVVEGIKTPHVGATVGR